MTSIAIAQTEEIQRISSREVAKMMEISRHSDMLEKIDNIGTILTNGKIRTSDYWIKSTYKDSKGELRREYLVSKRGCELLAHKSTGQKGVLFTVKYMERFEKMEKEIKNPFSILSKELQAIFTLDSKQQDQERRITEIEDKMTLNYELALNIQNAIKSRAVEILGGKDAEAYKRLSKKLFSSFHKDIKRTFRVNSYKNLSIKNYDEAIRFIEYWEPKDEVLNYAIQGLNSQLAFE